MTIKSLSYCEYSDQPRQWHLEKCDFVTVNLVVGRNATGKTRLINVLNGLCRLLSGNLTKVFDSGKYAAEIEISGALYSLELEFRGGSVIHEQLIVDGEVRLSRDADGKGRIFYNQEKQHIGFQVASDVIAIQQRRDELQHPYVVTLYTWARNCQTWLFGTAFGKDQAMTFSALEKLQASGESDPLATENVVQVYSRSYERFGVSFDKAIKRDMKKLGYPLSDVGTDDLRAANIGLNLPEPIIGLFVQEVDRAAKLFQQEMSQGMFRALALIIHLNTAALERRQALVLIDDIGEGLDYERSSSLIEIVIGLAKKTGIQIVMTSNDRFVMNKVPLEYWTVLKRKGAVVRAYSERNSPKKFKDFKYMGLSNFDFFSSAIF